jgi:hypothetical protein
MKDITVDCLDHLKILGYNEFFVQYEDEYTFTPLRYYTSNEVKTNFQRQ